MQNTLAIAAVVVNLLITGTPSVANAKTLNQKLDAASNIKTRLEKAQILEFKADNGIAKEKIKKSIEAEKTAIAKKEAEIKKAKEALEEAKIVDTTGFDKIYREAGKKYNVDWHILSGVHYIETHRSGDTAISSYAGALGPMQFMPPTWAAYGVDGDGDGQANINDAHDAIFSAANYLAASGADRGDIYGAIFAYNHSSVYVNDVLNQARLAGYNQ